MQNFRRKNMAKFAVGKTKKVKEKKIEEVNSKYIKKIKLLIFDIFYGNVDPIFWIYFKNIPKKIPKFVHGLWNFQLYEKPRLII